MGRGTIRVAVSLERLQATIIRAALPPGKAPVGVPLGAGVGAGGVARAAVQESQGEEALPPAELSCKVRVKGWEGRTWWPFGLGLCVVRSVKGRGKKRVGHSRSYRYEVMLLLCA